jgi:PadR family transcriptional regulator PadR
VLLLLKEASAHGYDLIERLVSFGIGRDPGGLYRMVRALEGEGLVRSRWQIAASGRDRRMYELTDAGEASLHAWVTTLGESRRLLERFAHRYDTAALAALEFVP